MPMIACSGWSNRARMKVRIEAQEAVHRVQAFPGAGAQTVAIQHGDRGDRTGAAFPDETRRRSAGLSADRDADPGQGVQYIQADLQRARRLRQGECAGDRFRQADRAGRRKTGSMDRATTIPMSPSCAPATGVPTPPDNVWGHFHANFPEIWLVVEGTQQFLVEGEKLLTVDGRRPGGTPTGRWHRASPMASAPPPGSPIFRARTTCTGTSRSRPRRQLTRAGAIT